MHQERLLKIFVPSWTRSPAAGVEMTVPFQWQLESFCYWGCHLNYLYTFLLYIHASIYTIAQSRSNLTDGVPPHPLHIDPPLLVIRPFSGLSLVHRAPLYISKETHSSYMSPPKHSQNLQCSDTGEIPTQLCGVLHFYSDPIVPISSLQSLYIINPKK